MALADYQAIIFDLDGLVLDSETGYFAAWRMAASAMGYELDDDFCGALSGLHGTEVYQRLQQRCGDSFDMDRFGQLSRDYWLAHVVRQPIAVKPGFHRLLDLLKRQRLPFALATNSRRTDALFCLANAGLESVFPVLACRDDVANGKPAPDLILHVADLLAVAPANCLVLEDSPIGVTAAKRAGAGCIFVPSRMPADPQTCLIADGSMDDLNQVAEFVSANFAASL